MWWWGIEQGEAPPSGDLYTLWCLYEYLHLFECKGLSELSSTACFQQSNYMFYLSSSIVDIYSHIFVYNVVWLKTIELALCFCVCKFAGNQLDISLLSLMLGMLVNRWFGHLDVHTVNHFYGIMDCKMIQNNTQTTCKHLHVVRSSINQGGKGLSRECSAAFNIPVLPL